MRGYTSLVLRKLNIPCLRSIIFRDERACPSLTTEKEKWINAVEGLEQGVKGQALNMASSAVSLEFGL